MPSTTLPSTARQAFLSGLAIAITGAILFSAKAIVAKLISVVFLKKKITSLEWIALGTAYLGTVLVFLHDVRVGTPNVALGGAFVLGSAISYALYLLQSGELVRRVGALRLVAYAMCVSSVACIVQFFLLRPATTLVQPMPVYELSLVNAVLCTVLPVFLTMIAVDRIGPATASQAGMIGPVSTLFMGAVILGEPITGIQLAGTALVLAGIYLLSRKRA